MKTFPILSRSPSRFSLLTAWPGRCLAGGCFVLAVLSCPGASYVWNVGSGDWSVPANWSPNGVPGSSDTATITNGGTVTVSASTDVNVLNFGNGTLDGAGTLTVGNAMNWTAGYLGGTGKTVIAPGATLTISNSAYLTLAGRTLENGGTAIWTGSSYLTCRFSAVISNRLGAVWEARNDQEFQFYDGGVFYNAGIFRKTASTGTTTFGIPFNNYGTVELQTGALDFSTLYNSSNITVADGALLTLRTGSATGSFTLGSAAGLVWVANSYSLNAGAALSATGNYTNSNSGLLNVNTDVAIEKFWLAGTLSGAGTLTVSNAMNWTAGYMGGTGKTVIAPGATLNISNSAYLTLAGRTLENGGTTIWTGSSYLTFRFSAVMTNRLGAVWEVRNDQEFQFYDGGVFNNAGTFRKTPGMGTTTFGVPFNNSGTVELQTGTLDFSTLYNLSNITVAAGALLSLVNGSATGAFTVDSAAGLEWRVGGNYSLNAGAALSATGHYTNNGSGLNVNTDVAIEKFWLAGTLSGTGTLTVSNAMNWTAGYMGGTGKTVIAPGATLNISNSAYLTIHGRTLENGGTTIWTGTSYLSCNPGSILSNRFGAVWEVRNDQLYESYGGGVFNNAGTFRKTASTGTTTFGIPFNNYGTVSILSGIVAFTTDYNYYSRSNAILDLGIGGTIPGTGFGRLQSGGIVALDGALSVGFVNGFVPNPGDVFTGLVASAVSGTFASFYYPSNDWVMGISNTPSSVYVKVVSQAPDTTSPTILCNGGSNLVADCAGPGGTPVNWSYSVSDNRDTNVTVTCVPASGAYFFPGTSNVICSAVDASGNSNFCSFTVTVQDTNPPVLVCPSNIMVFATSPAGAALSFSASATDACDGSPTIAYSHSSGSVFPPGTNTVTCTATDSSGKSNSCRFTVLVLPLDYGDAPYSPSYHTRFGDNGARHATTGPYFGSLVAGATSRDGDLDGAPGTSADGDDTADGNDDEEGVRFLNPLIAGMTVYVEFNAPAGGQVDGWIDFNADHDWNDAGEQVFTNLTVFPVVSTFPVTIPSGAIAGTTYARFRISTAGGLPFDGPAPDGEVEDYQIVLLGSCYCSTNSPRPIEEPLLFSWATSNSDRYAEVRLHDNDLPTTIWDPGMTKPVFADIQAVEHSTDFVYVSGAGLASYVMGAWYLTPTRMPGTAYADLIPPLLPSDQHLIARFPRIPVPLETGHSNTTLAEIGLWVNGTAIYDARDALSWSKGLIADDQAGGSNVWHRDAHFAENVVADYANQHQGDAGQYHSHFNPAALRLQLGEPLSVVTSTVPPYRIQRIDEPATPTRHSPIVGWAFDGHPIYGPYGYSDAQDTNSGIRHMVSGYVKRDGSYGTVNLTNTGRTTLPTWAQRVQRRTNLVVDEFGPSPSRDGEMTPDLTFEVGRYIEDHEHLGDLPRTPTTPTWDLDQFNGRCCKTPEFPGGTYAYFITIDASGVPAFPYILGLQYCGIPSGSNLTYFPEQTTTDFRSDRDWGDAPDMYHTLSANNGPYHRVWPGWHLGTKVDQDSDGQPTTGADGDDDDLALNDEDGVAFLGYFYPGAIMTNRVTVATGGNGFLSAWFDLNRDGDFADPGEQVLTNQPVVTGTYDFTMTVPSGSTYARFRLSDRTGVSYDGYGSTGEVEDYVLLVVTTAPPGVISSSGVPNSPLGGAMVTSNANGVLISNLGTSGQGGVSIGLLELSRTASLQFAPVNFSSPGTSLSFGLSGMIADQPGVTLGRVFLRNNHGVVELGFWDWDWWYLRMDVYNGDTLVGTANISSNDVAATLAGTVQLTAVRAGEANPGAGQWTLWELDFAAPVNFTPPGLAGNRLRIVAVNPPGPLQNLMKLDVTGANLDSLLIQQENAPQFEPQLRIAQTGGQLQLNWDTRTAILQSAPNPTGPWTNEVEGVTALATSTRAAHRYFRVVIPAWFKECARQRAVDANYVCRRNILLVIADDLGVDQVKKYIDYYGNPARPVANRIPGNATRTDTLDKLHRSGVTFLNAWSSPVCSPTRACLYTGNYSFRHKLYRPLTPLEAGLDSAATTMLPKILNDFGYASGLFGKWHLGEGVSHSPLAYGWKRHYGSLGGGLDPGYTDWQKVEDDTAGVHNEFDTSRYATTANAEDALAWIQAQTIRPWMATVAFNAPHDPWEYPDDSTCVYITRTADDNTEKYRTMLECLDLRLRALLDGISASEMERTTIIFMGDNGTPVDHGNPGVGDDEPISSHFPLGKNKDTVFEGGINVPLIIADGYAYLHPHDESPSWYGKGRVAALERFNTNLVQTLDLFATCAAIAGGDDTGTDSISLLRYLEVEGAAPARDYIFAENRTNYVNFATWSCETAGWDVAMRNATYKLIVHNYGTSSEVLKLYNLIDDRWENTELLTTGGVSADEQTATETLLDALDALLATEGVACTTYH